MTNNLNNASQTEISNPSIYNVGSQNIFSFVHENPSAFIILNRGTSFELNISSELMSFSTSNGVDDVIGSFSVVLNNRNDQYVDRYGNVQIPVASSIEIYAKTSNSRIINFSKNPASASNTITVSEQLLQSGTTGASHTPDIISASVLLDNIINQYYGFNTPLYQRQTYAAQISMLNATRTSAGSSTPIPFMMNGNTYNTNIKIQVGDQIKIPPIDDSMRRIFWGIVTNVSQNISPGATMTVTLNGKSLGYWLEASYIDVQPSFLENQYQNPSTFQAAYFANKYDNSTALDIFKDLVKFSTADLVATVDLNLDGSQTSSDYLQILQKNQIVVTIPDGTPLTTTDSNGNSTTLIYATNSTATGQVSALINRQQQLFSDTTPISNEFLKPSNDTNLQQWKVLSQQYAANQTLNITPQNVSTISTQQDALQKQMLANPLVSAQYQTLQYNIEQAKSNFNGTLSGGQSLLLNNLGIIEHWLQIFSQITLEYLDYNDNNGKQGFLATVHPFGWDIKAPELFDGDYQNKADIGRAVAEAILFEFYFDTNGHFVVKPPLYSITQQNNNSDYIVTDNDVYSMNINDTLDGIISRIGITGGYYQQPQMPQGLFYNVYQDFNLIKNYGVFSKEINNLYFLTNNADCRAFGRAYMGKNNQELRNASITIYGRPEIRLGTSIYIQPRDTVYYIKGISHDYNEGDGYTTTLTLIGARKIIRGFLAHKQIYQYYKVLQKDGSFTLSTTAPSNQSGAAFAGTSNSENIPYYIQYNGTNFQNAPLSSQPGVNQFLNQSPTSYNVPVGPQADVVYILNNIYIITSHPNPILIGMLVDQNSVILQQINTNYFNLLTKNLQAYALSALQSNTNKLINTQNTSITSAVQALQNIFYIYIGATQSTIPPSTSPSQIKVPIGSDPYVVAYGFSQSEILNNISAANFTYSHFNFFIQSQYQRIIAQVNAGVKNSSNSLYNQLDLERQILDNILQQNDAYGSYKQYTDDYGRELPVYLDYGNSLEMAQGDLAFPDSIDINNAVNSQSKQKTNAARGAVAANSINTKGGPVSIPSNSSNSVISSTSNNFVTTNTASFNSASFGIITPIPPQ